MVKNIIRQYVRKRTTKKDKEGIMITLPDPEQVEFKTSLITEILMRNGVDPNTIKTDEMLENVMKAIERKESMEQGIVASKQADIFNLSGEKLDPSKPISGGTQEGKKIKSDFFFRKANRPETDAEIKARLEKGNQETIEKILERKNRPDVYGLEDYDTTNMSNIKQEIIKTETQLGNLNPDSPDFRERAKPLIDKITELQKKLRDDKADGGRIGLKDGMDRRTFMKIMGGLATLPFVGKFVKGAKLAAPAVKKVADITAPALDKIIDTVMSAGKLVSQSGRRLKELTTKKKLKDVEVEEDMMDGPSYTIKTKDKTIYYKPGKQDEMGIEDDIIEVIEDTVTKKAGGGIARMLGE